MTAPMERERILFDENVQAWRSTHLGKYVLIKGDEIIGFFADAQEVFNKGLELFGLDEFFIEQVRPPDDVNVTFFGKAM